MSVKESIRAVVESPRFKTFITVVIILNAITLGMETSASLMASAGTWLHLADQVALGIFTAEILLKLAVYRWKYFTDGWNWFDFLIVAISLVPFSSNVSVLRALRILRTLRLFSVIPQFRRVVNAFVTSIPGMSSIIAVLMLVFYITAVLATKLYGEAFPEYFGDLGASMFTMFQIMTLENWADGVVRPAMEVFPWAWLFFVPFIVITSFAVLNLFIGILVGAIEEEASAARQEKQDSDREALLNEIRQLRSQIHDLAERIGPK
ncbi:MAG: ion transporter [Bacteroidetes bacterium]|nr:ion transporter [Bacteroidota bacterium]